MDKNYKMLLESLELQLKMTQIDIERWLQYHLFSWNWWLLVIFLIAPWMIWVRLVDRKKIIEILLFGMIIIFLTVYLDTVGLEFGFWVYPMELIPIGSRAIAFDAGILPVGYMLIFQYFRTWRSFSFALVCMALIFAFVGEPFTHWADLVYYIKWKSIYSLFFYLLVGLMVKWFVDKLSNIARLSK